MKIQPLFNHVLIEPLPDPALTTASGLAVAGSADYRRGRVLAVGGGRQSDHGTFLPIPVEIGDILLYD